MLECLRNFLAGNAIGAFISVGCAASPADHAANIAESAQYSAELQSCIDQAKPLPVDQRMPAYQACACAVDAKHGLAKAAGCP